MKKILAYLFILMLLSSLASSTYLQGLGMVARKLDTTALDEVLTSQMAKHGLPCGLGSHRKRAGYLPKEIQHF